LNDNQEKSKVNSAERPLRIALVGTRGIPGGYSGFETAVEEIGTRMVMRGHDVTVYCRPHATTSQESTYKGCHLVHLRTIHNKYLDTIVHTFVSTLHMCFTNRVDVAIYFIAGNSPLVLLARMLRINTLHNVDGLDSKRQKWPKMAKRYLRFAEWLSARVPNITVTDSREVQKYYKSRFGRDSVFIPYGAETPEPVGTEFLEKFGLSPREYFLFVGRLVPENCAHVLIEAFSRIKTDKKLVIVGSASYSGEYIESLEKSADPRVIFTGYLFGEGYHQLSRNAYVFVVPTEVGGTHPVILEAMGSGNCVLVNNHPPNLEVIADAGVSFDGQAGADDLSKKMVELLDDPETVEEYRLKARLRVKQEYSWDSIVDKYEELCYKVHK
jgi:glycosyltransferase involved in cell wall biosynthesis